MTIAQIVLYVGVALWLIGMLAGSPLNFREHRNKLEYWWAGVAFFLGGFGPLSNFLNLPAGSSEIDTLIRLSPLLALGVLMVISSLASRARIPGAAAMLVLVFAILGTHFIVTPALMALASLAVFLPALITPSRGYSLEALQSGAKLGVTAVLGLLTFAVALNPSVLIGACRIDKCSIWGQSLGAEGSGNALGMVLAASAGVVLLTTTRARNFLAITAGSYLLVDLTSSRSALNSWIIAVGMVLAYKLSKRTGRRFFVGAAALTVAIVVAVFPFLGWAASDFTNRGALWAYAIELYERSPLFGYGSSFWVRGSDTGGVDLNYSTHNLTTELLVSVGFVGTAAIVLAFLFASNGRRLFPTAIYTTALIGITIGMSVTEVFSAPGRTYLMAGLVAFVFVAAEARMREPNEPGRATDESMRAPLPARL